VVSPLLRPAARSRPSSNTLFDRIERLYFRMTTPAKLPIFELQETSQIGAPSEGVRRVHSRIDDLLGVIFVAMLLLWIVPTLIGPVLKILPTKTLLRRASHTESVSNPAVFTDSVQLRTVLITTSSSSLEVQLTHG
jgi:hypothetical protein